MINEMYYMFGLGVIVGIVFNEIFRTIARYIDLEIRYQSDLWEARIEAERYLKEQEKK